MVKHGQSIKEIDESLACNHDEMHLAFIVLQKKDVIQKQERLIQENQNAVKLKYQRQLPEVFGTGKKSMQSTFAFLQHQNCIERLKMLMLVIK